MPRLLFVTLLLLASCSTSKAVVQSYVPASPVADTGITFLVFNAFQKDSLSLLQVTHYKTYVTAGILKRNELPERSPQTTHIIQLQSSGNVPVLDLFLDNPMLSTEESFSENGQMEAHQTVSTSKTLSFRFQSVKGDFDHAILYAKDSTGLFIQSQFITLIP